MKPNIVEGDRVLVNKLAYDLKVPLTTWHIAQWRNPERGDIVVFFSPADGRRMVKRVIGLPGDVVTMDDNAISLNGRPIDYSPLHAEFAENLPNMYGYDYRIATEQIGTGGHPVMVTPDRPALRSFDPIVVPAEHYLVLGDNRDNSADSRVFGTVERQQIIGKVAMTVMSFDLDNMYLPRRDRWFKSLP